MSEPYFFWWPINIPLYRCNTVERGICRPQKERCFSYGVEESISLRKLNLEGTSSKFASLSLGHMGKTENKGSNKKPWQRKRLLCSEHSEFGGPVTGVSAQSLAPLGPEQWGGQALWLISSLPRSLVLVLMSGHSLIVYKPSLFPIAKERKKKERDFQFWRPRQPLSLPAL